MNLTLAAKRLIPVVAAGGSQVAPWEAVGVVAMEQWEEMGMIPATTVPKESAEERTAPWR